jgi:formylglycine-generating enzyme required for sulfatase activity
MKKTRLAALGFCACIPILLSASANSYGAGEPALVENRSVQTDSWREPLTGMEFVRIPGGCFQMGSPSTEEGRRPDEGPVHRVCMDEFWMGKHEVSRVQFKAFIEATGYKTDAEREGFAWGYEVDWIKKSGNNWKQAGFEQGDDHPVVNVSFNDAEAMTRWLSEKSGNRFRLPTEAEWEYACRAATPAARFWGDESEKACKYANVADLTAGRQFHAWTTHQCEDRYVYTAPVGSYEPNGFGLRDLLGNVGEWCADAYHKEAYGKHSEKNPGYSSRDSSHVVRGGSWFSRPETARCAARDHLLSATRRSNDLGFRLVRSP